MNRARLLKMEERAQLALATWLRRRGRPVRVEPFPGVGVNGLARVRGRVLVSVTKEPGGRTTVPAWQPIRANLAQFLTVELPGARVEVEIGGRGATAVADREGYLDVTLDGLTLTPGSHTATLTPVEPAGEPVRGIVHVLHPEATLAVVSDIDDTIIDSGIAHGILATVTTALLRDAASRVPLTGAPELYRELARGATDGPPPPFFYLSTSPWNLVVFLEGFLEEHGFPSGPLLLTDWGPGTAGLLRIDTRTHKMTALRELATLLPEVRFVLVGDSGAAGRRDLRRLQPRAPGSGGGGLHPAGRCPRRPGGAATRTVSAGARNSRRALRRRRRQRGDAAARQAARTGAALTGRTQTCRPHSVFADPAQRPARASSPGATRRVQGAQPIEG